MADYTLYDSNNNIIPLDSYSKDFVSKSCTNLRDLTEKVIFKKANGGGLNLENALIYHGDEQYDIRMDAFDQITTLAAKVYNDHPELSNFIIDCPFTPNYAFYDKNIVNFVNEFSRKTKIEIRGNWALFCSENDDDESTILQLLLTNEIIFLRL